MARPLYDVITFKNGLRRVVDVIILILLVSVVLYRLSTLSGHGGAWVVALLCESWFTLVWLLSLNAKWTPRELKTYPERLLQRGSPELPAVDMFVTTADPELEPPIITANTVLSLLAVDYPANKLACYVSDDAASALSFFSLVEAVKFAKLWVPFCKRHNVQVRAPFRYFSDAGGWSSPLPDFQRENKIVKDAYEELRSKIEKASKAHAPCDLSGEYRDFTNIDRRNHPSIIKVIWENKEESGYGVPHLIYVSREKREKQPHHYKAGAMNVLTRVSGTMTNAPIMMNVDCDMYAHNPQVMLHAMCLLLGFDEDINSGFIQFPQMFYDGREDEPFGNELVVFQAVAGPGANGIQGPLYAGTGCFHRRKCIYGASPHDNCTQIVDRGITMEEVFGNFPSFTKSAAQILFKPSMEGHKKDALSCLDDAHSVAKCSYEFGTAWGDKVGWLYGSAVEDVLTGSSIHARGWRSVYCRPDPPGFLGCVPSDGPIALLQHKRWSSGLLEILFSKYSPVVIALTAHLRLRQCLLYIWILTWALRSIPEVLYATLPAYAILSNTSFIPSGSEFLYLALVVLYNLNVMIDYLQEGFSLRTWLNCQRMSRVITVTANLLGLLNVVLKLIGLAEIVFDITKKDQTHTNNVVIKGNDLTFDESPIFISGSTLMLVNLIALAWKLLGWQPQDSGDDVTGVSDIACSVLVIFCFWSFVKGLLRKGKYGIPSCTLWKSLALVVAFVILSRS